MSKNCLNIHTRQVAQTQTEGGLNGSSGGPKITHYTCKKSAHVKKRTQYKFYHNTRRDILSLGTAREYYTSVMQYQ